MLEYDQIKVVIIGQAPYPGICTVTKKYYACGPAFMIDDLVLTCPVSLKNLFIELRQDLLLNYPKKVSLHDIKNSVKSWILQGVFLTNLSLTIGTEENYLQDHKNLWTPFTIQFVKRISSLDCPVVLLGKDTWFLSEFVHNKSKVLTFYHPASRDSNLFFGFVDTEMNMEESIFEDSDEDDVSVQESGLKANPFTLKGGLSNFGKPKGKQPINTLSGLGGIDKLSGVSRSVAAPPSNFPMLKKPITHPFPQLPKKEPAQEAGSSLNEKFVDAITQNNREIMNSNKEIINALTVLVTDISTKFVTRDELKSRLQTKDMVVGSDMNKIFDILEEKVSKYGRIVIDPQGRSDNDDPEATVVTSFKEFLAL